MMVPLTPARPGTRQKRKPFFLDFEVVAGVSLPDTRASGISEACSDAVKEIRMAAITSAQRMSEITLNFSLNMIRPEKCRKLQLWHTRLHTAWLADSVQYEIRFAW